MPLIRAYRPRYISRVKVHRVLPKKKRVTFARKVKRILNREHESKVYQINPSGYADLEAASQRIVHLTPIAQGDDRNQRTGNVIEPTRLQVRLALKRTSALDSSNVRIMVIKYKTCDGTTPSLADILPYCSATSLTALPVEFPLDTASGIQQQMRKFRVMYDKTVNIHADTNDSASLFRLIKINKKLSGKIFYTGTNSTDEGNNQLYLFVHTDAVDDVLELNYCYRFWFKDA